MKPAKIFMFNVVIKTPEHCVKSVQRNIKTPDVNDVLVSLLLTLN